MKKMNIRIDDIEIRPYKEFVNRDVNTMYEIVKWKKDSQGKDYCYVVSFAKKSGEDYDIVSVGKRPWELSVDDEKNYNIIVKMFFELTEKFKDCDSNRQDLFDVFKNCDGNRQDLFDVL